MEWTFGIPTLNNDNGFLDAIIDSIERQGMPKYEIIVVGNCSVKRKNTRIIRFDESVKKGWISRKKNLIANAATFENICIMHDYMVLDDKWYSEFEKFTDDWDVCMNQIVNLDGIRFRDWLTWDSDTFVQHARTIRQVPYDDNSHLSRMYVSGGYFCVKKSFLLANPFDEKYGWGEGEDVEWSQRIRSFWNYKCNPRSIVRLLKQKWHDPQHMESV